MRSAARWIVVLALLAGRARAEEREVELHPPKAGELALDNGRLIDAIRIHTRDVTVGEPGAVSHLNVLYDVARGRAGSVTVIMHVWTPGQPVVRVVVRGRVDEDLYRALALKVRAALLGDPSLPRVAAPPPRSASPPVEVPPPPPPPAPPPGSLSPPPPVSPPPSLPVSPPPPIAVGPAVPSPPPAPSPALGPVPPPPVVPAAPASERFPPWTLTARRELGRTRPLGLALEAGPRLLLGDGASLARGGVGVTAALSVGTLYEVALGFAFDGTEEAVSSEGRAETRPLPITASLRLLFRRGPWCWGGGPRLGVLLLRSVATGEEARLLDGGEARWSAAATLGGEALVRYRAWRGLHAMASLALDLRVPDVWVRIDETPTLHVGQVAATGFLGIAYTIP